MIAAEEAASIEDEIIADLATFEFDPLGYVLWAYPWGEDELSDYPNGPRAWQREFLTELGDRLRAGIGKKHNVVQMAVASGHGPGKSALVAWVVDWAMKTHEDTRGVVTAGKKDQLVNKTWPELVKWQRMSIASFMVKLNATSIHSAEEGRIRTWRIDAEAWSKENTEAFQGLHNARKRIICIYDEASAVIDGIWEVTEGALTDEYTQIIWLAFGNPTKNTGRFRECFGKFKHRWWTRNIDTRKVEGINKEKIAEWQADYGEDSDWFRVRVRGEFPGASDMQFISNTIVEEARRRPAMSHLNDTVAVGVDVARFGNNKTCLTVRKGRDARTVPRRSFRGLDTNQVALKVMELVNDLTAMNMTPDAIFIDEGGVGGGVVDNCRRLGLDVIGVQFGGKADRAGTLNEVGAPGEKYKNKRAEMWGAMRQWLRGGAIEDDGDLAADLVGPEYGLNGNDEIVLESKDDMVARGLASPDDGDALALTFAYPVHKKNIGGKSVAAGGQLPDYDPYGED